MTFIMHQKNYTEGMLSQNVTIVGGKFGDLDLSSGKCIFPNLNLVMEDAVCSSPNLTILKILEVLNQENVLVTLVSFGNRHVSSGKKSLICFPVF